MKKTWIILLILSFLVLPAWAQKMDSPAGMVWIGSGNVQIGSEKGADNEKPSFETTLAGFWIDIKPITVGDFRKFVRFNHYLTTAEKKGYAMCYDSTAKEWKKVWGANWKYPKGTEMPASTADEPIRQISWYDAQAYANWIGKRLPSELEWEKALQNAKELKLAYVQQDLWQWCDNWYFAYNESNYFTEKLNRPKSLRGGSHDKVFRTSLRHALFPEECFYNVGFRCVKDR